MTFARTIRPVLGAVLFGTLLGIAAPAEAQYGGGGGGWTLCAREHEFCQVNGAAMVRYGIPGRWIVRQVAGGIPCNNEAFRGDPARNVYKVCEVQIRVAQPYPHHPRAERGAFCAQEGAWCQFRGTRRVLYGANGRYLERVVRGSIPCTNEAFGGDPMPMVRKACFVE